jgi:hypothetical protein
MRKILSMIICTIGLTSCTKNDNIKREVSETKVSEKPVEKPSSENEKIIEKDSEKLEIIGPPPKQNSEKFKVDEEDKALFSHSDMKHIMVAIMAPMSGKYDMVGNAIIDGAHMALIDIFNKNKIPVRLTTIDSGSGVEDIEFNISKLDETNFDIILGLTKKDQREFVEAYIGHNRNKPKIMSLLPDDCAISPQDQLNLINSSGKQVYIVLPMSESESNWKRDGIKIMQYGQSDVEQTTSDLMKIAEKIEEESRDKRAVVIFTEGNWKLQKFIANIDSLKLNDRIEVVLASLSNLNGRIESVNEKRHKFGNIGIIGIDSPDYNKFIKEFYSLHNRKPLEVAFLSYNIIKQLRDSDFDGEKWSFENVSCKAKIKLFQQNYK